MSSDHLIIGVGGRSGSGKSTLVRRIQEAYSPEQVCLHAMDNYYRPQDQQFTDVAGYSNWDLPLSFFRKKYHDDLHHLIQGRPLHLLEYSFNNKSSRDIVIQPAPVIIVEGLFVFYYREIYEMMDLKVMMNVDFPTCFERRLRRDQEERNYEETEIRHLYTQHAEPAYQRFIKPFKSYADILIANEASFPKIFIFFRFTYF
ncbi:MAG: deoxynucleoside kinase [Bacteroidota bacterium]